MNHAHDILFGGLGSNPTVVNLLFFPPRHCAVFVVVHICINPATTRYNTVYTACNKWLDQNYD